MTKIKREMGQLVVDFANAETTDEACFKHFYNMQNVMGFNPDFADQMKNRFPGMSILKSLNELEGKLFALICEEKSIKLFLNDQFRNLNLEVDDYNVRTKAISLAEFYYDGEVIEGEPDFNFNFTSSFLMEIDEFKNEYKNEIGYGLRSDTFNQIDRLMEVGGEILDLKSTLPEDRYDELYDLSEQSEKIMYICNAIENIQKNFRNMLEMMSQGGSLIETPGLLDLINYCNGLPKFKYVLANANLITEKPPITEGDYFILENKEEWVERFKADLSYCLIEFLVQTESKKSIGKNDDKNRRKLKKCQKCGKFFISLKDDTRIKYCPTCSLKRSASKERQREYVRRHRKKKKEDEKVRNREAWINRLISTGFSEEDSMHMIKTWEEEGGLPNILKELN